MNMINDVLEKLLSYNSDDLENHTLFCVAWALKSTNISKIKDYADEVIDLVKSLDLKVIESNNEYLLKNYSKRGAFISPEYSIYHRTDNLDIIYNSFDGDTPLSNENIDIVIDRIGIKKNHLSMAYHISSYVERRTVDKTWLGISDSDDYYIETHVRLR